jgi:hypothetical protein
MAQLYPRTLGSLFVTSYNSSGYRGGFLTRLHSDLNWLNLVGLVPLFKSPRNGTSKRKIEFRFFALRGLRRKHLIACLPDCCVATVSYWLHSSCPDQMCQIFLYHDDGHNTFLTNQTTRRHMSAVFSIKQEVTTGGLNDVVKPLRVIKHKDIKTCGGSGGILPLTLDLSIGWMVSLKPWSFSTVETASVHIG